MFSGDQHYPSAHILNWQYPLKPISQFENSIEFSLQNLGTAVFDFSASPLNYKRATGHPLIPENQKNPLFSFEIFRAAWGIPKNTIEDEPPVIGSVYGLAEVNTESSPKRISVKFYELNHETLDMVELYHVGIIF